MSYLTRLALRALGRPVHARLAPRIDSQPRAAAADDGTDAIGGERATEAFAADDERGVRDRVPAATRDTPALRPSPSGEPAPGMHSDGVRLAHAPADHERAQWWRTVADDMRTSASAVEHTVPRVPAPSPPAASRHAVTSAAHARSSAPASNESQADRAAPSAAGPGRGIAAPVARPRDGAQRALGTPALTTAASEPGDALADAPAKPVPQRRPASDPSVSPRALQQSELLRDASARAEPAAISVEIGRIEVRIAPPPAPAARPRAGAEGFEGYWRLRNYLERAR